jgi:alpha-galactosidase
MSEGGDDFASTVGVGGVVGTNFTWPVGSAKRGKLELTPQKEKIWEKWVALYKEKMLSRGEYLGTLYDIGFDKPEAHAIRKGSTLYYAFFAPRWQGQLELRGLKEQSYRILDYENGKDLGRVNGPAAVISVEFQKHFLLLARPE